MDTKITKSLKPLNGKSVNMLITDPFEHQQKCWMNGNFYEAHGSGLLAHMLRNKNLYTAKRCLDIGASIGNHTIFYSKILNCRVVAIEPVKSSFDHLRENCELNNVRPMLINIALGNKKGKVTMENVSKKTFNVGMYQVRKGKDVELNSLDNLKLGQFDFIKIDVEHYNVPLLEGAEETFKTQKDCDIYIECETPEILNITNEIMKSYGYYKTDLVVNHTPTYLWKK